MTEIKALFAAIGREDLSENDEDLLSSGAIDSLDIMALIAEIEKLYKKSLRAEFIRAENFESFKALENMLKEAMKEN